MLESMSLPVSEHRDSDGTMASESLLSGSTSLNSLEDIDSLRCCSCETPAIAVHWEPRKACDYCRSRNRPLADNNEKWLGQTDEKQRNLNELILNCVLDGCRVRKVGDVHWAHRTSELFGENFHGVQVPGEKELEKLLQEKYVEVKKEIVERLKTVRRVATTADAWNDDNYTYLASTVHWIDEKTLQRRNAYLGLVRFRAKSTPELLMKTSSEFHRQFGLDGKIALMTVNSASNFEKVFNMFGEDPGCPIPVEGEEEDGWFGEEVSGSVLSSDEEHDELGGGYDSEDESEDDDEYWYLRDSGDEYHFMNYIFDFDHEGAVVDGVVEENPVDEIEEVEMQIEAEPNRSKRFRPYPFPKDAEPIDLAKAFAQDPISAVKYNLPKYFQCAARTLNLVATEDAARALNDDGEYRRVFSNVARTLKPLWNIRRMLKEKLKSASSRIYGIGKDFRRLFLIETKTTWDGSYGAFKYIASLSERKKKRLNEFLRFLEIPELGVMEFAFIVEYVEVLKPLVAALNLLLTDTVELGEHENFGMGYLVPSLSVILTKADQMLAEEGEGALKFCAPLLRSIKVGIEKRFGDALNKDFLVAAAVHPMFRLARMGCLSEKEAERIVSVVKARSAILRKKEKKEEKKNQMEPPIKKPRTDDDFFEVFQPTNPSQLQTMKETAVNVDIDLFLRSDPRDDLSSLGPLKNLYAETNVAMPACGMVARLFPSYFQANEEVVGIIYFLRANGCVYFN